MKKQILFTPGPANTTDTVKQAMVVEDQCPREKPFTDLVQEVRKDLLKVVKGEDSHTATLIPGSATYAIESCLASVVPLEKKIVILANGDYGERMVEIAKTHHLDVLVSWEDWTVQPSLKKLEQLLERYAGEVSHLAFVHHETSTGLLNPLKEILSIASKYKVKTIVDAVSSFGGIPLDIKALEIDHLIASANKCLRGLPGMAFVLSRLDGFSELASKNPGVYSLDLYRQWQSQEEKGEFLFTPPVQVLYALKQALNDHFQVGVFEKCENMKLIYQELSNGMSELGFKGVIAEKESSGLLWCGYLPTYDDFDFGDFQSHCYSKGYSIYPGKSKLANTFRLGLIGHIERQEVASFVEMVKTYFQEKNALVDGLYPTAIEKKVQAGLGNYRVFLDRTSGLVEKILADHSLVKFTYAFYQADMVWSRDDYPQLYSKLSSKQLFNHILGEESMVDKCHLASFLNGLRGDPLKKAMIDSFYPESHDLSTSTGRNTFLKTQPSLDREDNLWVFKPGALSSGTGIKVDWELRKIKHLIDNPRSSFYRLRGQHQSYMAQRYIKDPLLLNGKKSEIRVYWLIASLDPYLVFFYPDGLARYTLRDFVYGEYKNTTIHVTNIDQQSKDAKYTDDDWLKWSFQALNDYVHQELGLGHENWVQDDLIPQLKSIFTFIAREMKNHLLESSQIKRTSSATNIYGQTFGLYGADLILDQSLTPWLTEIQISPGLSYTGPVKEKIIPPMLREGLDLAMEIHQKKQQRDAIHPLKALSKYVFLEIEN